MVDKSAVIPIASFSAIVLVMLAFILWWFPRTWNKGNAQERAIVDEQTAYLASLRAQQQQGVNRPGGNYDGGDGGEGGGLPPPEEGEDAKPPAYAPRVREYRPPVAGLG